MALVLFDLRVLSRRLHVLFGNPELTGSSMGLFLLIGSPMVNLMCLEVLGPAVMPLRHRLGARTLVRTVFSRILFKTLCVPMPFSMCPRLFMLAVTDRTLFRFPHMVLSRLSIRPNDVDSWLPSAWESPLLIAVCTRLSRMPPLPWTVFSRVLIALCIPLR